MGIFKPLSLFYRGHCNADGRVSRRITKATSGSWTLASDVKLLGLLSSFSSKLAEKTTNLVNTIEELSSDTSEADVRLRNTFNEFLMLANTQFIENVSIHYISFTKQIPNSFFIFNLVLPFVPTFSFLSSLGLSSRTGHTHTHTHTHTASI